MKIGRFEETQVWKDGYELVIQIYEITNNGTFGHDFGLRDQIRRASVSIISNIAEGHERGSTKEFIHFLLYAKGSAGEVRAQLYIARGVGYLDIETFDVLLEKLENVSKQLSGFIHYLRKNNKKVTFG